MKKIISLIICLIIAFNYSSVSISASGDELLENENIINSNEKLNFTYVKPRGGIHLAYTCSEITSQSESIEFVNPTLALREVQLGIIVNFMISIPIILFYVILLIYKLIKGRLSRT